MAWHLYALLVGIDEYPPPSKPLRGCVNDAQGMEDFLTSRFKEQQLSLLKLYNQAATRDDIIKSFRRHLGKASPGDTALFFFGGHGSQESVAALYENTEPDKLSETLVAYDSRQEGQWDLADKELAVLIAEVAARGAHVLVILDSCHAGTATRDFDGEFHRRTTPRSYTRLAETYWFHSQKDLPKNLDSAGGWRILPAGEHVLFACCRDFESAREVVMPDGQRHGLFSYHLVRILKNLGPQASYRDLYRHIQIRVSNINPNQHPEAEGRLDQKLFAGKTLPRSPTYALQRMGHRRWRLNAGAVHGIVTGTKLAALAEGENRRVASLKVTNVDAAESGVEVIQGQLSDTSETYPAVLTSLPMAPLRIAWPEAPKTEIGQELSRSPFLTTTTELHAADVVVRKREDGFQLFNPHNDLEVAPRIDGNATALVHALEHIARWQTVATLENPASPLEHAIEMSIHLWLGSPSKEGQPQVASAPEEGGEIALRYQGDKAPRFTIRLDNRSDKALFFGLLALGESYAVKLLQGGRGRLIPNHSLWIRPDGISASVPDELFQKGITRRRDLLLLLVSDVDADFSLLEQGRIGRPYQARRTTDNRGQLNLLDALMENIGQREIDEEPQAAVHHWTVDRRVIVAER